MTSYGVQDALLFRESDLGVPIPGAVSIDEIGETARLVDLHHDGIPVNVYETPKDCTVRLTSATQPDVDPDYFYSLACKRVEGNSPTIDVWLYAFSYNEDMTHRTLVNRPEVDTHRTVFIPHRVKMETKTTPHLVFTERTMGKANFKMIEDAIYGPDGSIPKLIDTMQNGLLAIRRFTVIYNREGVWEVSGLASLITNHPNGEWEIRDINTVYTGDGEYILYEDYEEEIQWTL